MIKEIDAKIKNKDITIDWYKEVVINASEDSYDTLVNSIEHLIESHGGLDLQLSIKFN